VQNKIYKYKNQNKKIIKVKKKLKIITNVKMYKNNLDFLLNV